MLDVVDQEVRALLGDARRDRFGVGGGGSQPLGDRGQNKLGVAQRGEGNEDDPSLRVLGEQSRELDREAGLVGAAWPDDCEHAGIALVREGDCLEELSFPAEEWRSGCRKVDTS